MTVIINPQPFSIYIQKYKHYYLFLQLFILLFLFFRHFVTFNIYNGIYIKIIIEKYKEIGKKRRVTKKVTVGDDLPKR